VSLKRVYFCPIDLIYHKDGKAFTTPKGYPSDGASGAIDIYSYSWFAHDRACDVGAWDDGSPMTPKEASEMIAWYLKKEGRSFRSWYWKHATHKLGPKKLGVMGELIAYPELAGQIAMLDGGRDMLYHKEYVNIHAL